VTLNDRSGSLRLWALAALALLAVYLLSQRIGLLAALAVVLLVARAGHMLVQRLRSRNAQRDWRDSAKWPTAAGSVQHVSVARRNYQRGRPTAFQGTMNYSYEAGGASCTGSSCRAFASYDEAWHFMDLCRDQAIQVAYNPAKPALSVFAGFPSDPGFRFPSGEEWMPPEFFEAHLRSLNRRR